MAQEKRVVKAHEGSDFRGIGGLVKRLIHPTTVGSENLGLSVCYLNPGEEIEKHKHEMEEAYYVIQGHGTMFLDGHEEITLAPHTAVYVPSNVVHGQKNTGDEPLVIICALSPPPPISY